MSGNQVFLYIRPVSNYMYCLNTWHIQCKLQKENASYLVFFSTFTALIVRFLTRRFIGEYASSSGICDIVFILQIFYYCCSERSIYWVGEVCRTGKVYIAKSITEEFNNLLLWYFVCLFLYLEVCETT